MNGVQLGGWFVEEENFGAQRHGAGQGKELLLSAGELAGLPVEPGFHAEIGSGFPHPKVDFLLGQAEVFKAEGEFVPYLVSDHLPVRILEKKTDFFCGGFPVQGRERRPVIKNHAHPFAIGCKGRFQLPEQGGFAAAGTSAEHRKRAGREGKRDIVQRRRICTGIGKGQMLDFNLFHLVSSKKLMAAGRKQSMP